MGRQVPKRADWRVADGVRVEELDGSWLALDPSGGVVYRLEARDAEVMRLVAHRLPVPDRLVPAARELAGHGVLAHPFVDRRTAMVGAGVVTLTGLAATLLPSAARAASPLYVSPESGSWPVSGGTIRTPDLAPNDYYVHVFLTSGTLTVADANAITDLSILVVAGGGGGGNGEEGAGGGGGAGGVLEVTGADLPSGAYAVVVGSGGAGRSTTDSSDTGTSGALSSVSGTNVDLVALGGGGGGGAAGGGAAQGGSGGGGGCDNTGFGNTSGATVTSTGRAATLTSPAAGAAAFSGFNGGSGANASTSSNRRAGGGGGAGGNGVNGVASGAAGTGGSSIMKSAYAVSGVSGDFAGGGGGAGGRGSTSAAAGAGGGAGAGAGGYGTSGTASGGDAVANSGSGGGGGTNRANGARGGNGGSGIVLVRYRLA